MNPTPAIALSVVIVNYNGLRWLERLLDSLLPQLDADTSEVLFVDNASTDGSVAFVETRHPQVTIVRASTNRGYGAGVNAGLARARGEWLFVLNTDLRFPPGAVDALLTAARRRPRLGLAGPLLLDDSGKVTFSYGYEPNEWALLTAIVATAVAARNRRHLEVRPRVAGPGVQMVPYIVGACLLVRRAALDQVGPMDERLFMYYEDTDWSHRFRQAGWEVALIRAARVVHAGEGSSPDRTRAIRDFYISLDYFARKHYGLPRALTLRGIAIAMHGLGFLLRWWQARLAGASIRSSSAGERYHLAALRALIHLGKPGATKEAGS